MEPVMMIKTEAILRPVLPVSPPPWPQLTSLSSSRARRAAMYSRRVRTILSEFFSERLGRAQAQGRRRGKRDGFEGAQGNSARASCGVGAYVCVGEGEIISRAGSVGGGARTSGMLAGRGCGLKMFSHRHKGPSGSMTVRVRASTGDRVDRSLLRRIAVAQPAKIVRGDIHRPRAAFRASVRRPPYRYESLVRRRDERKPCRDRSGPTYQAIRVVHCPPSNAAKDLSTVAAFEGACIPLGCA